MNANKYNQKQMRAGYLRIEEITRLVKFYQKTRGLEADGKAGPVTLEDLRALFVPEEPTASRQPTDLALATLGHAIAMIGEGEEGGNNSGPFVEMLHGKEYDGDPDDDGNWCAAFVSEAIARACEDLGVGMPFQRTGGAKALYKRAGRAGLFSSEPAPGDLVCWHRGKPGAWTGHVALVEKVERGEGRGVDVLHTIEGNVGRYPSQVTRRQHRDYQSNPKLLGFSALPSTSNLEP